MGRCYICKSNTTQMCVGCPKRPAFVCDDCKLPCAWCGDSRVYCTECTDCQGDNHEYGDPGCHDCLECDKRILLDEAKAKCDVCDEFYYHIRCLIDCSCEAALNHYICKEGHECEGDDLEKKDYGCPNSICKRGRMKCLLPGKTMLVCPDHERVVKRRIVEFYNNNK